MPTHAELATIRKLSQYRPFERGGQSALEAQEDLLLAALAEAGGALEWHRGMQISCFYTFQSALRRS